MGGIQRSARGSGTAAGQSCLRPVQAIAGLLLVAAFTAPGPAYALPDCEIHSPGPGIENTPDV